jgi:hypothetical protein
MKGRQEFGMVELWMPSKMLRDAARRCYSQLREAKRVGERRALLKLMVGFWDRADELERAAALADYIEATADRPIAA